MPQIRRLADQPRTFTETDLPPYLLQQELIDVLQMGFQVKQAQWSLPNQDSDLSKTLSDVFHACLSRADEIVRSMATLGAAPDGRVTTVSSSPTMINLEPGWREEPDVAELATSRCRTFAVWAEERAQESSLHFQKALFDRIAVCFRDYAINVNEFNQPYQP